MYLTDNFDALPACMEIGANAAWWDPFGVRWGRGAHWPLLAIIGVGRYRSEQMRIKRSKKERRTTRQTQGPVQLRWRLAIRAGIAELLVGRLAIRAGIVERLVGLGAPGPLLGQPWRPETYANVQILQMAG